MLYQQELFEVPQPGTLGWVKSSVRLPFLTLLLECVRKREDENQERIEQLAARMQTAIDACRSDQVRIRPCIITVGSHCQVHEGTSRVGVSLCSTFESAEYADVDEELREHVGWLSTTRRSQHPDIPFTLRPRILDEVRGYVVLLSCVVDNIYRREVVRGTDDITIQHPLATSFAPSYQFISETDMDRLLAECDKHTANFRGKWVGAPFEELEKMVEYLTTPYSRRTLLSRMTSEIDDVDSGYGSDTSQDEELETPLCPSGAGDLPFINRIQGFTLLSNHDPPVSPPRTTVPVSSHAHDSVCEGTLGEQVQPVKPVAGVRTRLPSRMTASASSHAQGSMHKEVLDEQVQPAKNVAGVTRRGRMRQRGQPPYVRPTRCSLLQRIGPRKSPETRGC